MAQLAKKIFEAGQKPVWHCWKTPQRPVGGTGESIGMFREAFGFTVCRCQRLSSQRLSASLVWKCCNRCDKGLIGEASGLTFTHGMLCACAHHLASGTSEEFWVSWRALFLPHQEGALCSYRGSSSPLSLRRRSRLVLCLACI